MKKKVYLCNRKQESCTAKHWHTEKEISLGDIPDEVLAPLFAEIAQLVEHNLAKVGVASSSLVFRSCKEDNAQVAELVDAHVSGACVERRAGSTPVLGTQSRMS